MVRANRRAGQDKENVSLLRILFACHHSEMKRMKESAHNLFFLRFFTYFLITHTQTQFILSHFFCCDVNDSLIDVQIISHAIYHEKKPTINLCGKWKALIFFHCIFCCTLKLYSVCTPAKHCELIFLHFFICNASNLLISTTYGMTLKIYHLHFTARARTSEGKIESDTLFRSHSQLRSNEHDRFGLCVTRSWLNFLNFLFRFGFRTLRTANAQRSIYSLVSFRFFAALPYDRVSFSIHLLILNNFVCFLFGCWARPSFRCLNF